MSDKAYLAALEKVQELKQQRDQLAKALWAFLEYDEKDHDGVSLMDNDRVWDDAMRALDELEGES